MLYDMKTTVQLTSKLPYLVIAFLIIIGMPSCQDQTTSTYTFRTQYPVYLQMSNFRTTEAVIESGKELENPGKIYIYNDDAIAHLQKLYDRIKV